MELRSSIARRYEDRQAESDFVESPDTKPNSFPFLRLPYDIRVKVYREALTQSETLYIYRNVPGRPVRESWGHPARNMYCLSPENDLTHPSFSRILKGLSPPIPGTVRRLPINAGLLRTCKTVYAEALPILYRENLFGIPSKQSNVNSLAQLSGPGLMFVRQLGFFVNHGLNPIFHNGSPTFWDTVIRECRGLYGVFLSFPSFKHSWMGLPEAIINLAHSIAILSQDAAKPKLRVLATIRRPDRSDVRSHERTTEARAIVKKSKHRKYQLPKAQQLVIACEISFPVFSALSKFSKNGWRFKMTFTLAKANQDGRSGTNRTEPAIIGEGVLLWVKDSSDKVVASVVGQKRKR